MRTPTEAEGSSDDEPGSPRRPGVAITLEVACPDPVDGERWAALLAVTLADEGVAAGAEAGLTFVDEAAMAELNQAHMGVSGPTDVLAFPIDGREASGADGAGPPGIVGDVVVCLSVAAANAADHAGTPDDELALLVVHGGLHLVGHDHAEADERRRMQARERDLLGAHHGPLAGEPWTDGP